jgi:alkaline phosphatase
MPMRVLILLCSLCLFVSNSYSAKNIFLFIGDGLGVSHIALTEAWLAHQAGINPGFTPLNFSKFPDFGLMYTHNTRRHITGSAEAGTAMATGIKTAPNMIGVMDSTFEPIPAISQILSRKGWQNMIITCVSVDHATPAAFYTHQRSRSHYHEIGLDLIASQFEFFAGADFLDPFGHSARKRGVTETPALHEKARAAGYTIAQNLVELQTIQQTPALYLHGNANALPYRMDSVLLPEATPSLAMLLQKAIELKDPARPAFFMIEGGKIDWAGHNNDALAIIHEVLAFANAVDVALQFYAQNPKETMIIVTSDHETGGLSLGNHSTKYELLLDVLQHQKASHRFLAERLAPIYSDTTLSSKQRWSQLLRTVTQWTGLGSQLALSSDDLKILQEAAKANKLDSPGYALASASVAMVAKKAGIGFTTGFHTGTPVPVYALGTGSERFRGRLDNTDIFKKIMEHLASSLEE